MGCCRGTATWMANRATSAATVVGRSHATVISSATVVAVGDDGNISNGSTSAGGHAIAAAAGKQLLRSLCCTHGHLSCCRPGHLQRLRVCRPILRSVRTYGECHLARVGKGSVDSCGRIARHGFSVAAGCRIRDPSDDRCLSCLAATIAPARTKSRDVSRAADAAHGGARRESAGARGT